MLVAAATTKTSTLLKLLTPIPLGPSNHHQHPLRFAARRLEHRESSRTGEHSVLAKTPQMARIYL